MCVCWCVCVCVCMCVGLCVWDTQKNAAHDTEKMNGEIGLHKYICKTVEERDNRKRVQVKPRDREIELKREREKHVVQEQAEVIS